MNVNGSRFDMLLGRDDWGRCLDGDDEQARSIGSWWDSPVTSPPTEPQPTIPAWDAHRGELRLRPLTIALPDTPGERPVALDARRGAAADRNRNVYRISGDRLSLSVQAPGGRQESTFWPADPSIAAGHGRERLDFAPRAESEPAPPERYLALAVTADDYLVVAFASVSARGFLTFDLVAGGSPVRTLWPTTAFDPFDMAARSGGGVWVLDRVADGTRPPLLWELDCRLAVVSTAQPIEPAGAPELDDFQPLAGAPRTGLSTAFPGGVELAGSRVWVVDPIAVESLGEGRVMLLDRDVAGERSRVVRLRREAEVWSADASRWLDELPGLAHDFVYARARTYGEEEPHDRLFIVIDRGNQVRAYAVDDRDADFVLVSDTELFPLRRFGGRALIAVKNAAHYDSGIERVLWTPVVQQPRTQFAQFAELVTPWFDSHELGTTWDRVLLDACIPPDTAVEISSRAGDERTDLLDGAASPETPQVVGTWLPEPRPHLRSMGPELPWLRGEAARATRREAGVGTWELLLQNARGRYLQLRLRLTSESGIVTPRLRALRVWSPRFSYPHRFLPAVYREHEESGSLLERWLANCESTLTQIEDRVVNVQALFDPRAAPVEALSWLAEWFDVAFDPAWDHRRRRLFVAHAMDLFRWRGTVHGLRVALQLAFDECVDDRSFDVPDPDSVAAQRIRIVESHQTRVVGAVTAGDPGGDASPQLGLREVRRGAQWTPSEGNAGLADRYATFLGAPATPTQQITPFSLAPPAVDPNAPDESDEQTKRWRLFTASVLGFVPSIGAAERARWHNFLVARQRIANESVANVHLPRDWPARADDAQDWRDFSALVVTASIRSRWQDFLARRYRRIERLNRAYATSWPGFDLVPVPDTLPGTVAAQADWLQFERQVLPMYRTAHRFSVLLPVADVTFDPYELEARLGLARRIVELEKPAHTVFDVRFFWAFFRVGEARLEIDTLLGAGSRAPELIPEAVLGRTYVGTGFVGGAARLRDGDRLSIAC